MTDKTDIQELKDKLQSAKRKSAQHKDPKKTAISEKEAESRNLGLRLGGEFIIAIIACGAFGIWLDTTFSTKPIFFLLFFLLGVGVGFLNIYKLSQNIGTSVGFAQMHQKKETDNKGN